jgi:undecaprenyl-diphosphatase
MDQALFDLIRGLSGRFLLMDWLMIFFANYLPYLALIFFAYLIFASVDQRTNQWASRYYFLFLSALSILIARGMITEIVRFFYPRLRPFDALNFKPLISHASNASFPSGHAVVLFIIVCLVFYLNKKWFWHFLIGVLVIGLARVYVGVHWPSDILAGALLALLTVVLVKKFLPKP